MPFKHGDRVRLISERDRIGTIQGDPRAIAGEQYYGVAFSDGSTRRYAEADLEVFEGPQDVPSLIAAGSFGNRQNLSALITLTKLQGDMGNHIYAFYASRTQFFPHQFKSVIKFVESPKKRILIADEVGLGKTIEAGLIMAEERARHPLRRVLVVCPSALRSKWQMEMAKRFDESFRIMDAADLRSFLREARERGDAAELRGICSLQTLRGLDLLSTLESELPSLDLAIVDEAHHMRNPATLSHRAGQALSECSDGMVLMTATPVHLGNENLFHLLRLLDPEEFQEVQAFQRRLTENEPIVRAQRLLAQQPPKVRETHDELRKVERSVDAQRFLENPVYRNVVQLLSTGEALTHAQTIEAQRALSTLNLLGHVLTRTRKREVHESSPVRSPVVLKPAQSDRESQCYKDLSVFCMEWYARFSDNPIESFASISIQRQLASCLPATIERYLRGAAPLDFSDPDDHGGDQEEIEALGSVQGALPQIARDPGFQSLLGSYADLVKVDSKYDRLVEYLRHLETAEPRRKLIIFSSFKATVAYLTRRLSEAGFTCVSVSGDVPSTPDRPDTDERGRRLERFRTDPESRILISTEVSSEGLDLQFCHILVNYDLPWNPMVVEQRIGRIDRIGQKSARIIVANFSIPGTIEERILSRLYLRIGIFNNSIGDLEPILGEHIRDLTRVLMSPRLTDAEKDQQLEQAALTLERKRQDLSLLEEQSAQLIGHDEFFRMELERVRRLRRYITAKELHILVDEFIRREFPASSLRPAGESAAFLLTLDQKLINFLRDVLPSEDRWLMSFLVKAGKGRIDVTFDSGTAFERPELELVSNIHPIVRAIRAWSLSNPSSIHPVARVELATTLIPPGDYVFQVYQLEIEGIRRSRVMESIFTRIDGGSFVDADEAEEVLATIVERADTMTDMPDLRPATAQALLERIDRRFGERLAARKIEVQLANEALASNRLGSLDGTFRVKIERQESRVRKAEDNPDSKPQFIGMLRTHLARLKEEHQRKRQEIERGRRSVISPNVIAGGYLRVRPEPPPKTRHD